MEIAFMRHGELPDYESRPLREPAAEDYVPAVTIEGLPRSVTYGEFITGSVVVAPRMRLPPQPIRVELLCAESLLRTKLTFPDEYSRFYIASTAIIPNSQQLEADSRYRFSFSLPVPVPDNQKCDECGDGDFLIPPTLGGGRKPDKTDIKYSVIWFIKVSLINRLEYTLRDIDVRVGNSPLPFKYDTDTVFEDSQRLTEGLFKKHSLGILSIQGKSVQVTPSASDATNVNLMLSFSATKQQNPQKILKSFNISYSLQHVVRSRHLKPFCAKGVSVEPIENRATICTRKIAPQSEWNGNSALLSFDFTLPNADIVPNYTTCLCTSFYELVLTVRYSGGSIALNLPVVISRAPPSYT